MGSMEPVLLMFSKAVITIDILSLLYIIDVCGSRHRYSQAAKSGLLQRRGLRRSAARHGAAV